MIYDGANCSHLTPYLYTFIDDDMTSSPSDMKEDNGDTSDDSSDDDDDGEYDCSPLIVV